MRLLQDTPPGKEPAPPGKKWVKVTVVVDGHDREEWQLVDAGGGPTWPARDELRVLNHDIRRVEAPEKVTGRARFTHDVRLPQMVYARLLRCPHPVATVSIDLAPALAIEGVVDAIELEHGGATRYLGQPVAAVAAETAEQAEDGLRAIAATFEEGDWVVDYEQSVAPDAPQVTSRGNVRSSREVGELGAATEALNGCDAVVEATYTLPVQHHVCLETHGFVVDYRGGDEATAYASTQGTFIPAGEIAEELGIPSSQVRVLVPHMGGGFGSKFQVGVEGQIAARLAKRLRRPVHLMLTRSDEFHFAGNRSGSHQVMKGGATRDGRFVALVQNASKLGGIGGGSHPGTPYIYAPEHSFVQSHSVMTNTDSGRAMRAPGHPQASFAIESLVDELAYAVEQDLVEFRIKNLEDPVYHRQLERCAKEIGWYDHPHRNRPGSADGGVATGIGFGVATWGGGGRPQCQVEVRIDPDGSVTSSVGSQDLGTGVRTYVAAIVAEEFGLPVERVTPRIGSTDYGNANASGGSVTTACLAPAVKDAAHNARVAFLTRLGEASGVDSSGLYAAEGEIRDRNDSDRAWSWEAACALLGSTPLVANGQWQADLQSSGVHGAQAAKVEVDTATGAVRVVKMVAVQDCGLPMNRMGVRSQIHGGLIQALSYGLFEERVIDPWLGVCLTGDLDNYKIAGTHEIPEIVAIIDDDDQRSAVIGMAEPAIVPGQSAIANAVHNACGARIRDLPMTPDKILAALGRS